MSETATELTITLPARLLLDVLEAVGENTGELLREHEERYAGYLHLFRYCGMRSTAGLDTARKVAGTLTTSSEISTKY